MMLLTSHHGLVLRSQTVAMRVCWNGSTTYSRFNVTAVLALQNRDQPCVVCYKVLQAVSHALCPFNVTAVPSWLRIREQNTKSVLNAYVEMINDLVVHQIN